MKQAKDKAVTLNPIPPNYPNWSEEVIEEVIYGLHEFFNPRQHWSGENPMRSSNTGLYITLTSMLGLGAMTLGHGPIEEIEFNEYEYAPHESDHERRLRSPAARRRRNSDLQSVTWMAGNLLMAMHPKEEIEPFWNGLPFAYVHRPSGTVVTAGNIDCERMIKFMLRVECSEIGIVGTHWAARNPDRPDDLYNHGPRMNWMKFSSKGIAHLNQKFEKRDADQMASLAKIMKKNDPFHSFD